MKTQRQIKFTGGSVRNTNFIINLGLENNPHESHNIIGIMEALGFKVTDHKLDVSEYNGDTERTLIIKGTHSTIKPGAHASVFNADLIKLCSIFNQECIAYKVGWHLEVHDLAYNIKYKERYEFNDDLFIDL